MTDETILEVARELIGPIHPIGDCTADAIMLEKLRKAISVARGLLADICEVADCDGDPQHSVAEAGMEAMQAIHTMIGDLQEVVEEDDA